MRRALLVFSALMAAFAAGLLAWANWPVSMTNQTGQLHLIAAPNWGKMDARLINAMHYEYMLNSPVVIRTGQTGRVRTTLTGLPAGVDVAGNVWQLHIRSELVLPGFANQQEGMISQVVQADQQMVFTWDLKAMEERHSTGVVRTYIDYISPDNQVETQLLSVTDLELTSASLSGLTSVDVTGLAVAILLLAGLAGGLGLNRRPD
jgi:hypothetical protein